MKNEPIHVLSEGCGVQSSCVAMMASEGLITPMPYAGIFADTQDEPSSVYEWIKYLQAKQKFPLLIVTNGSLWKSSTDMHVTHDGRAYSRTNIPVFTVDLDGTKGKIRLRSCTRDFKIVPIIRKEREILGDKLKVWRKQHRPSLKVLSAYKKACVECRKKKQPLPAFPSAEWAECQADPLIVLWIGISADEIKRMKPSREPWIIHRWPLVELGMKRGDCLTWMKAHGHPEPPRSACVYCPFHDNKEWHRLKTTEPGAFTKAAQFERELQVAKAHSNNYRSKPFLHKSVVPLDTIDFDKLLADEAAKNEKEPDLFTNECEGLCGN